MTEFGVDEVGLETLERIAGSLSRYNDLLFEQVEAHLGESVLEIGSGIGNLSAYFIDRPRVVLTDISPAYIEILTRRFGRRPNVSVFSWDLGEAAPEGLRQARFESILCSNVLEHIEDDRGALERMRDLLEPEGTLVLLVPAFEALYTRFDEALGHFRRYSAGQLREIFSQSGYKVESTWYFNALGALGWYVNGRLLRRKLLPTGQMRLFDRLVPLLRLERALRLPFGVSVIAIARKL